MDALSAVGDGSYNSGTTSSPPSSSGDLPSSQITGPRKGLMKTRDRAENRNGVASRFEKQHSWQDFFAGDKAENDTPAYQRGRSNSDGAAMCLTDNAEAFPSLPNTVLEKLGLYGDVPRERVSEESLEQKFTSLALAFTIDATTIKDRCERQRRSRDQTESNFNLEVEKLKQKLTLLQPLCTDFETADLLSTLFSQVETLEKAASLVSIAAERYGAVQHEERLTESVQLMVGHVQALKQQRDSARKQLQYTKRVLQEPVLSTLSPASQKMFPGQNKKMVGKRRASTDSVNVNSQQSADANFKLNRRISDLSFRASLSKSRPSRLDLGMELNKIREVSLDDSSKDGSCRTSETTTEEVAKDDFDSDDCEVATSQCDNNNNNVFNEISSVLRLKVSICVQNVQKKLTELFAKWSETGYLHAFLNSCAVLCFSVSILTLVSIFFDQGSAKGSKYWVFSWANKKN